MKERSSSTNQITSSNNNTVQQQQQQVHPLGLYSMFASRNSIAALQRKREQDQENLDLELNHVNNLDLWRINTQEQLRNQVKFERKTPNYSSSQTGRKQEPLIKMNIINNIMQSGNNSSVSRETAANEAEKAQRKANIKLQQGRSISVKNLEFFKSDNNKSVVNQIITNKLRSIYNHEKKIDYPRLCAEKPRIEGALKNFRSLSLMMNNMQLNLVDLTQQVISDQTQPHKIFDFSVELKRIESERLDFVNVERKVLEKITQLQYNTKLIKESKHQVRSLLYDLESKLNLFNPKIITQKYERLENNMVIGYFQERKRGDSSKFNVLQIKEKLKQDDVFIGYIEKLKEAKGREIEEYCDAKGQISSQCQILRDQLERLQVTSHETKENCVKCKMQLRDMYIDLLTNRLHIFLESQNVSWIARGFTMIGEEFPIHKLPRYIDAESIEYIRQSGSICYQIQNLDDRKPQVITRYNQDSETTTQILKEIADKLNSIPLINDNYNSSSAPNLSYNFSAEGQVNLNVGPKISFVIPDLIDTDDINNNSQNSSSHDNHETNSNYLSSTKQGEEKNHFKLIKQPSAIQRLFSSHNVLSTEQRMNQEESNDIRPDYSAVEKKIKELKLQLSQLKRTELSRLLDLVSSKILKEEPFRDSLLVLFGQKEQDRVLMDYYTKHKRFEALQQQQKHKQSLQMARDPHRANENYVEFPIVSQTIGEHNNSNNTHHENNGQAKNKIIQRSVSNNHRRSTQNPPFSSFSSGSTSSQSQSSLGTSRVPSSYREKAENILSKDQRQFSISTFNFLLMKRRQ